MLLPAAPVGPALVDRRHLLIVPLNYIRKPRWVLLRLQLRATVTCAQQVLVKGREEREGWSWGSGREWGQWSQCEVVEPLL